MVVAGACCVSYTAIVVGRTVLDAAEPITETTGLAVLTMFTNAGTFLVVAIVAGSLAEEFRSAQSALEHHRKDLGDLLAFKDLLVESVGTGLVAVDLAGRITTFNRAAAEITGIAASEALGRPWSVVFGQACALPDPPPAGGPAPPVTRAERLLRRADGRDVPVSLTVSPLRSGDGRAVGLIVTCESLASIREMEARVRQADRLAAVGRMAANIAHEIRNPLASMTGAVEFLARDTDAATRERLAQIVLHESERLDRIIRDLLDYARPAPLNPQAMNLTDTLDDVLTLLEHRPLPDSVKIIRAYGGDLPVDADPQQLRQVFWNLCLNAVEALPDGGQLSVGARRLPAHIEVWVSDTGTGIHDADLPHVFEPFFSTKSEGSGIGLALVHRIIREHGGEVDVRSVLGVGTTFSITLPAARA
jgi:two-component system sensor histidine kinase PilS (NtrC family)